MSDNQPGFETELINGFLTLQETKGEGPERVFNMYALSAQNVGNQDPALSEDMLIEFIKLQVESFITNCDKYFL